MGKVTELASLASDRTDHTKTTMSEATEGSRSVDLRSPRFVSCYHPPQPGSYILHPKFPADSDMVSEHSGNSVQAPLDAEVEVIKHSQNHICASIIVTFFCFCPIGIFAMEKAIRAHRAKSRGDLAAADHHEEGAKKLIKFAIICGFIIYFVGYVIVYIVVLFM